MKTQMGPIRVLLAEDHTIVRKGIRALLDAVGDIDVVGEAENGREAVEKVTQLTPDVVLMDNTMPILNGLEATRQIKKQFPEIMVLILTMHTDEEYIFQFLQAGASGYLIKKTAPKVLVSAIKAVHRGDSFLSPSVSRKVIDEYLRYVEEAGQPDSYTQLTSREREVLQLLAEGFSNKEIAEQLHLSIKTVANHRINLMEKLDIHNLSDLTKYAIRKGITNLD